MESKPAHPRLHAVATGQIVDLTNAVLGVRGVIPINVSCSALFFRKVLGASFNGPLMNKLNFYTKQRTFTVKLRKGTFSCRCASTKETINGVQTTCYTFFLEEESK